MILHGLLLIGLRTKSKRVPDELENALLRWRKMYLDALRQMNEAHEIKSSPIIKDLDRKKSLTDHLSELQKTG